MKQSTTRILLLISGILLAVMGVVLFATPGANSAILAWLVCILMVVFGILEIVFYIRHYKIHVVSGWVLADGIITVILAMLLLCMPKAQILTMSIMFAVWVLFTGVTRTSAAFVAKSANAHNWGWILAAGILGIVLGIWLMCDPLLAIMTIGYLVPLAFLIQGLSAIAMFFGTGSKH